MPNFSKSPSQNTLKRRRKSLQVWSDWPDTPHPLRPTQKRIRNNIPALRQFLSRRVKWSACISRYIRKPAPSYLHRFLLTDHMREDQREQSEGEIEIDWLLKQFRLNRGHLHGGIPDHENREEVFQGVLFLRWGLEISHPLALHDRLDVQQHKYAQPYGSQSSIDLSNTGSWGYFNAQKGRIKGCDKK